jgi:hypothetical protein
MTWIAITDQETNLFSPNGFLRQNATGAQTRDTDAVLPVGSLVVETRLSPRGGPQTLLEFHRPLPQTSRLSLQAMPTGGVVLVVTQGTDVYHASLDHQPDERTDVLRITYSWDVAQSWGRLSVELPETGKCYTVPLKNPKPLALRDIRDLALFPARRNMHRDVVFVAASTKIEPIGPMPSLTSALPIRTPQGYRKAWDFRRGDVVSTSDAGIVPVLHTLRRTVPAFGSFSPVRLRAPYFGLQQDIVVAPHQRLMISGSRVEYMFSVESVLVPACHLVNGRAAVRETGHQLVSYCHLLLPDHECLDAAGTEVESLNIGRIRRRKAILEASLLAPFDRATLPDHTHTLAPVLRPFEAISLAEARAA